MNFNDFDISVDFNKYNICDNDFYKCYFEGAVLYKDFVEGNVSVINILQDFNENKIEWNQLYGGFRVIIINKLENTVTFFTDNAGISCFYYHEDEKVLSDSFIKLLESTKQHNLDMKAVAGYAKDGLVYGDQTICKEIKRFSSDCFFLWNGEKLKSHTKILKSFDEIKREISFSDFTKKILNSISGKKIASVITGGVDSRWILSMLLAENIPSDLFISGKENHIDVKIAEKIAKRLNKSLVICNGVINTDQEFDEAFKFSDGVFNCVELYRLFLLQNTIKKRGYDVILGGVGGEFYKNSFINQDFPIYWGSLNKIKFIKEKVSYNKINETYFTEDFLNCLYTIENSIQNKISNIEHGNKKSKQAIDYGYWVLKQRMVTISNSNLVPHVSLLVERNLISLPYKMNPYSLEMNMLQRKEITKNAPSLINILTDRKVSTSINIRDIFKDAFNNYFFLFMVYIRRIVSKKEINTTLKKHNFNSSVIESRYKTAFVECQNAGIFKDEIVFDEIDRRTLDNLLPVGILISKYFS